MYKRKRLYDRKDTYRDTGIPCGNPKRVHTGEVLCMPGSTMGSSDAAQSGESSMTQGEEQLRVMARRQLNTNISRQELVSQHRQFTEAGRYKPALKEVSGMLGLTEYQTMAKGDDRVEQLRQCGLTDDEIFLQLSREGRATNGNNSEGNSYGPHPDMERAQLASIDSKLREKEASLAVPDSMRGLREVSRHLMDMDRAMFQGTPLHQARAVTSLLTTQQRPEVTGHPDDPINHLPQILAEVEERAKEKIKEKRRRRRRNRRNKYKEGDDNGGSDGVCDDNPHQEVNYDNDSNDNRHNDDDDDDNSDDDTGRVIGCLTFEEMQALKSQSENTPEAISCSESATDLSAKSSTSPSNKRQGLSASSTSPSNKRQDLYIQSSSKSMDVRTIKSSRNASNNEWIPVEVSSHRRNGSTSNKERTTRKDSFVRKDTVLPAPVAAEPLSVEHILHNRLTLQQIQDLPKFADYEAGTPSNVLYVKNLCPRCKEADLVSLFGGFQQKCSAPLVYRLMTGRMRGQAFVTFDSTDVATQALQLVNGYLLHDKPVIVQYGHRTAA